MIEIASILKALTDGTRVRIWAMTCDSPRSIDEIAAALGLDVPVARFHLSILWRAGLIEADDPADVTPADAPRQLPPDGVAFRYSRRRLTDALRKQPNPETRTFLPEDVSAYDRKVLDAFLSGGRLKQIPVQKKKQDVVLRYLAEQFEPGRDYTEQEVNFRLLDFHDDYATLRRALVDAQLMERQSGIYRRSRSGRLI